ncbi:hypothetical protein GRI75_07060 [Altererythrobacter soli]|uniref:Uncharacterized protein n=1 Tax=Croceibacterium soli TaxID=1739690 RepID=A0A6I4UQY3_9SPHN|nr:hypothetical protein [Croceibacterium soli]MXP41400.1 hypothetical protein [Croceibacterium soli]
MSVNHFTARHSRHPELVSGSIVPPLRTAAVEEWMLKQVQHDEEKAAAALTTVEDAA